MAFSRPGYGMSSRMMGRGVADVVYDTASLLDHLGVDEFGAAVRGAKAIEAYLMENYAEFHNVTGAEVAEALGGLVSAPDKAVLTADFAENMAKAYRWALHSGFGGWTDDDLAFTRDWGFDLESIKTPVTIWQGQRDNMVPGAHGKWLAEHIPGAEFRNDPDQGHISLVTAHLGTILEDLARHSG